MIRNDAMMHVQVFQRVVDPVREEREIWVVPQDRPGIDWVKATPWGFTPPKELHAPEGAKGLTLTDWGGVLVTERQLQQLLDKNLGLVFGEPGEDFVVDQVYDAPVFVERLH